MGQEAAFRIRSLQGVALKIFNHDIRSSGPSWLKLSPYYASRALCLTNPGDVIQLSPDLKSQFPAIHAHYARVGIPCTDQVVWDLFLERTEEYPDYPLSAFYFGKRENRFRPDPNRLQMTQRMNSKNEFIHFAQEHGIPVPLTYCFENTDAALQELEKFPYPCYLKPAVALSGIGISRNSNKEELSKSLHKLPADIPVQVQQEVHADRLLNIEYQVQDGRAKRLLVSEQIMEGYVYKGNRVPALSDGLDVLDEFAGIISAQGMQEIFAFDVVVSSTNGMEQIFVLECNPRYNGVSYPGMIAQRLGVSQWSAVTLKTPFRDLRCIDLVGIEYGPDTGTGVILVNWGAILHGELMVMLIGNPAEQDIQLGEIKRRISGEGARILLTPAQMERVTAGRWRNLPTAGVFITGVNFYLPWVKPGDLFIDRKLNDVSEGKALRKAFEIGAVAAVVEKNAHDSINRPLLEVNDVQKAFQDLALASSLQFDGAKILVTGSHGKTGFKTQLFHVLNQQIPTHAHLDSSNLQNPIFRTLTAIPRKAKVVIVETAVPAEKIGEDRTFFIRPNFCVITGVGLEHLSSHKTVANLIMNKAAVVTGLRPGGKCILNADDASFAQVMAAVRSYSDCEILTFGSSAECSGQLVSKVFSDFGWDVRAVIQGQEVSYRLPLIEDYAPLASVSVLLLARQLGADIQQCAREFASYQNYESSGNLYQIDRENGSFHVYDQSRRGEWKGFESMFELMGRLTPKNGGRKIAVLTEFINFEDNPDAPIDLDRMGEMVQKSGLDLLFSVHQFKAHSSVVKPPINWVKHGETYEDILDDLIAAINPNDMVFVRGIEDARLDKLVNNLLELGLSNKKIY